jgi:hypothetical protein
LRNLIRSLSCSITVKPKTFGLSKLIKPMQVRTFSALV